MKQSEKHLQNFKHIHFVGIKGVGMAPLAIIAKQAGIKVSGCDIEEEFITDFSLNKAGIKPLVGFSVKHIVKPDLVVTTGAHGGFDNPEVKEAKKRNIPVLTQGQAVGLFMQDKVGISVAGSHGKTTIAAMMAVVFAKNNLDPSYLVGTGSLNKDWLPGHWGKGKYFIAEADEYANEVKYDKISKFLYQNPKLIIISNIEFDHPDQFRNVGEIRDTFLKFIQKLPKDGVLIANGDDSEIKKIRPKISCKIITYGIGANNDFVLTRTSQYREKVFFWAENKGLSLGEFTLSIPGTHNALNAISVIIASLELGISVSDIKKTLPSFLGTKRRFEFISSKNDALIFDDYAHHPTEIKATLRAARLIFPKKKIVCIFQPHTYSRTKALFNEFVRAFGTADEVLIADIFPSQREKKDISISSQKLVDAMKKIHPNVKFLNNVNHVIEYAKPNTVIITMGAGDIYKVTYSLLAPACAGRSSV